MNAREKKLALILAVLILGMAGVLLFHQLLLKPWNQYNQDIARAKITRDQLTRRIKLGQRYEHRLETITRHTLGSDPQAVSEAARARLLKYLTLANLSTERFSLTPVTGKRLVKQFQEVGWHIKGRGRLDAVVDFLYLIQTDPYLHGLSTLSLSYTTSPYEVDLQVSWITLVMPAFNEQPQGQLEEPAVNPLDEPARQPYRLIAQRDLFRPYMAPPPPRPVLAHDSSSTPPTTPPSHDRTSRPMTRVVGLPVWPESPARPEVIVLDSQTHKTTRLNIGDELAGGRIVCVDYRPLALPDKPQVLSPSRVILVRDGGFWAIELGHYTKDLYRLDKDRLPDELLRQAALEP